MNNSMVTPAPLTSVSLLKEGVLLVVGADTGKGYHQNIHTCVVCVDVTKF